MNILDVWFDSGSSHEAVLSVRPELTWPSDLYLEGSDQHRGWFQSSLLLGLGTRGRAPYRQVVTHGFLLDTDGQKMSKSLGNVIVPQDVIKQSGADILRLWVSMSDYQEETRVSKEILARVAEAYRKIRNTLRYLLSNLYDFDPARDRVELAQLEEVDRYILARYAGVVAEDPQRLRGVRLQHDLPGDQRVRHGRSERVLRGRLERPPLYVRGGFKRTAIGTDGDVRHGRRPGAAAGAHSAVLDRRAVAISTGDPRRVGAPRAVPSKSRAGPDA